MWSELQEEIELELAQLRRLLEPFESLREKVETSTPDAVEITALAGFLHAFYTGIENLFKRVAVHLDGGPPRGEAWHSQLLDNMALPGNNRSAVITQTLHVLLRRYLEFRHVFRHAYTFELKWEKMEVLVLECEKTLRLLESELDAFLKSLESGAASLV